MTDEQNAGALPSDAEVSANESSPAPTKHIPATALAVRWRLPPAVLGLIVFSLGGWAATNQQFWHEQWFWIGLSLLVSATVAEPRFVSITRAGIANGIAGIALFVGGQQFGEPYIWWALLTVSLLAVATGLIAVSSSQPKGQLVTLSDRLSSIVGRAKVIGTLALAADLTGRVADGQTGAEILTALAIVFWVTVFVDWQWLAAAAIPSVGNHSQALAAIAPRLLLVTPNANTASLPTGQRVAVRSGSRSCGGHVVGRSAHRTGIRIQIALDEDWDALATGFPADLLITLEDTQDDVVGIVREGSTDTVIKFVPSKEVGVGDPVSVNSPDGHILYQIATVELARHEWDGAVSVRPLATATQVGLPRPDRVVGRPFLPSAHAPVFSANNVAGTLPEGYHRVGVLKGTSYPIGVQLDEGRRGHFTVLGMSGMGKTGAAQRLCAALAADHWVLTIDTTGEYKSRLGFAEWNKQDYTTNGSYVHELEGSNTLPKRTADLIEQCMGVGMKEYKLGRPKARVLLLEEAHGLIPEFNNISFDDKAEVLRSTRFIMQARKFALTFVIVSQRTAVVSKSGISQCENYVVLRTIDETSLTYLGTVVGPHMKQAVSGLPRWDAVCVGPAFNTDGPVIITLDAPPPPNDIPGTSDSTATVVAADPAANDEQRGA